MPLQSICRARVWLLFGLGSLACSKPEAAPSPSPERAYTRGDRVVVEQAAAQFFEGRVLATSADHLRVQAAGDNDSRNVVASDVYRLPAEPRDFSVGALAICGHEQAWVACRVQNVTAALVSAVSATGEAFDLPRERVLQPSALTELNLKRFFERTEAELSFAREAERAGEPHPDPSWRPAKHERLLVKVGNDWLTGYVRELGDEGVTVTLGAGQRALTAPLSAFAPEPPSGVIGDLRHGDFVLLRPDASSEPWARWQIRAVNDNEIKLADASGGLKTASIRDVVLLRP